MSDENTRTELEWTTLRVEKREDVRVMRRQTACVCGRRGETLGDLEEQRLACEQDLRLP